MFKTILVPLDRSSLAEQALGPATAIAQASGGEIELVLAHLTVPHGAGAFDAKDPAELIYLRRTADEIARRTGVVVGSTVVAGTPVDAIGRRDYPVILGVTMIIGAAIMVVNVLVDLVYVLVDPRVSVSDRSAVA